MYDCDEYVAFRDSLNGVAEHEDIGKLRVCLLMKWTEEEYYSTSYDFINKIQFYLEMKDRKLKKQNGR